MNYKMIFFFGVLVFNLLFGFNYSEDISPIIYNNCTTCHRSGEIGAFLPLTNYLEVYDNRYLIAYAIEGEADTGTICINGAACHKATINDKIKTIKYCINAKLNGLENFFIKISINMM